MKTITEMTRELGGFAPTTKFLEAFAELVFEQGRQEGMKQERALWTLSELGQEIEAQPERPWVGLTEDEVAQAMYRADAIVTGPMQFKFAKELEAKLKEKNT